MKVKEVLKVIGLCVLAMLLLVGISTTLSVLFGTDYKAEKLKADGQIIDAYYNYYQATETFLDSIGVDEGDTSLETDEGSWYLENKYKLDSIYAEQNHGTSINTTTIKEHQGR